MFIATLCAAGLLQLHYTVVHSKNRTLHEKCIIISTAVVHMPLIIIIKIAQKFNKCSYPFLKKLTEDGNIFGTFMHAMQSLQIFHFLIQRLQFEHVTIKRRLNSWFTLEPLAAAVDFISRQPP